MKGNKMKLFSSTKQTKALKSLQVIKVDKGAVINGDGLGNKKVPSVQDLIDALEELKDTDVPIYGEGRNFDFVYPEKLTLFEVENEQGGFDTIASLELK